MHNVGVVQLEFRYIFVCVEVYSPELHVRSQMAADVVTYPSSFAVDDFVAEDVFAVCVHLNCLNSGQLAGIGVESFQVVVVITKKCVWVSVAEYLTCRNFEVEVPPSLLSAGALVPCDFTFAEFRY